MADKDWPEDVLTPNFVLSIYKEVIAREQSCLTDTDMSYKIGSFSLSGKGYERNGFHLALTCDVLDFSSLEIAQASEEALLEQLRPIHRGMMSAEYKRKFEEKVNEICSLKDRAESLAEEVRSGFRRLETS